MYHFFKIEKINFNFTTEENPYQMVKVIITPAVQKIEHEDVPVWKVELNRFVVFIQREHYNNFTPRSFSGFARYEAESLKFFGAEIPSDYQNGDFFTHQDVSVPKSWYLDQTPKPKKPQRENKFKHWKNNQVVRVSNASKTGTQQFRIQSKLWRYQKHANPVAVEEVELQVPDVQSFNDFPALV